MSSDYFSGSSRSKQKGLQFSEMPDLVSSLQESQKVRKDVTSALEKLALVLSSFNKGNSGVIDNLGHSSSSEKYFPVSRGGDFGPQSRTGSNVDCSWFDSVHYSCAPQSFESSSGRKNLNSERASFSNHESYHLASQSSLSFSLNSVNGCSQSRVCFLCRNGEHIGRQCLEFQNQVLTNEVRSEPKVVREAEVFSESYQCRKRDLFRSVNAKSPLIQVSICGRSFLALLDTGASVSLIGQEVMNLVDFLNIKKELSYKCFLGWWRFCVYSICKFNYYVGFRN